MWTNSDCAALILLAVAVKRKKKNKQKRIWCKPWYKQRMHLEQAKLLKGLEFTSRNDFKKYVRMESEAFGELLSKVGPLITKQDTMMRQAIPARHRLSLTLYFLTSGNSFEDLKFLTAIAPQTIGKIVMETCEAIIEVLKDYIQLPTNENEWKMQANAFSQRWNFPNCIGALDGKNVDITKPPGTGSYYLNHKKQFSIALMAVVNANYEFLMVDIDANRRASDAGLLSQTLFFSNLIDKKLQLPNPEPLPKCSRKMPFVFVSDDEFPLMENIMKPFSHNSLKKDEIIFNYRLTRARGVVDNTFGLLASRFRILLKTINLSPEKVKAITLTCCYLHNFLRKRNDQIYFTNGFNVEDTDTGDIAYADWHKEAIFLNTIKSNSVINPSNNAKLVRKKFCQYFNTVGAVPWQNKVYEKLSCKNVII